MSNTNPKYTLTTNLRPKPQFHNRLRTILNCTDKIGVKIHYSLSLTVLQLH